MTPKRTTVHYDKSSIGTGYVDTKAHLRSALSFRLGLTLAAFPPFLSFFLFFSCVYRLANALVSSFGLSGDVAEAIKTSAQKKQPKVHVVLLVCACVCACACACVCVLSLSPLSPLSLTITAFPLHPPPSSAFQSGRKRMSFASPQAVKRSPGGTSLPSTPQTPGNQHASSLPQDSPKALSYGICAISQPCLHTPHPPPCLLTRPYCFAVAVARSNAGHVETTFNPQKVCTCACEEVSEVVREGVSAWPLAVRMCLSSTCSHRCR